MKLRPGGHHPRKHKPTAGGLPGRDGHCTFVTTNVTDTIVGGRFIVRQHAIRYGLRVFVGYTCGSSE